MSGIPALYRNREINFDKETLEKLQYLNFKSGKLKDRYSWIINDALKKFFEKKFQELKIQHYVNEGYEADLRRAEERIKAEAKERDDLRLLKLAKVKIIEDAIEAIKKEEKKTGIKKEPPADFARRYIRF